MVAGECSVIAGVIVTCILAVLSGLCLVLALVFFVYARRKLEQVSFVERSQPKKIRAVAHQLTHSSNGGAINGAFMVDDLNMQEAGSNDAMDGCKNGIPGYVVCKEFIQNSNQKWGKGLSQDKLVYRLMASDVKFEMQKDEDNGSPYLAFSGLKESSPLLTGAGKLLKNGDRVHAMMVNCSALMSQGSSDESLVELLLKLLELEQQQDRSAIFVDVAATTAVHERLVDAEPLPGCNLSKENELGVTTAEMRHVELSTTESKDSGREDTRTSSDHVEDGLSSMSSDEQSPQKTPKTNGSLIARSRHERLSPNSSDQAFHSTDSSEPAGVTCGDVGVALDADVVKGVSNGVIEDNESAEVIELAQHPSSLPIGTTGEQLPLPGPDLLQTPPNLHSPPSQPTDDDDVTSPTSPRLKGYHHQMNGSTNGHDTIDVAL